MAKKAPTAKPASKSEVFANIATATGLTKKQVTSVFEALTAETVGSGPIDCLINPCYSILTFVM